MKTYLSDNFTLEELTRSAIADRLGIDNTPPPAARRALYGVVKNDPPARADHFKSRMRRARGSGARRSSARSAGAAATRARSAGVGARRELPIDESSWKVYFARKSHPTGSAVDFELPGIAISISRAGSTRISRHVDQLILEFYRPGAPASDGSIVPTFRRRRTAADLTIGTDGTRAGLPTNPNQGDAP